MGDLTRSSLRGKATASENIIQVQYFRTHLDPSVGLAASGRDISSAHQRVAVPTSGSFFVDSSTLRHLLDHAEWSDITTLQTFWSLSHHPILVDSVLSASGSHGTMRYNNNSLLAPLKKFHALLLNSKVLNTQLQMLKNRNNHLCLLCLHSGFI
ncbi:hypothetical protein AVEN_63418-1 [Araneus ventricosus]|uniref:Uncharacterized protein n=1 Tax=Araneus ventricosus TaxID=182803 RepID=A0A4Y2K6Z2_ARAVE|nr:hypothetical protein AVEN_63418-1 [Araneus ventricosus]